MKRCILLSAMVSVSGFGVRTAQAGDLDSFSFSVAGPIRYTTTFGDPFPIADAGQFSVESGTFHGLRLTYTLENTDAAARLFDMSLDLYAPGPPVPFAPSLVEPARQTVAAGAIGDGPRQIILDLPIFFFRDFNQAPTPFSGGTSVGLRARNGVLNSTATWSDINVEFYESVVSNLSGDTASTGTWNRPSVNPALGIDNGRASSLTGYTAIEFTVDADGTYGVHTQFTGSFPRDGWTFLFEGDAAITGDYSNLLDADSQGVFGVGHTDINSVDLSAGRKYTLLLGNESPGDVWDFEAYIVGPGSVTVVPAPGVAGVVALGGALSSARRRRR